MTEQYIPSILRARWDEAIEKDDYMLYQATIGLCHAFLNDIARCEPNSILIPALNGVIADCQVRIKSLMPKAPTC